MPVRPLSAFADLRPIPEDLHAAILRLEEARPPGVARRAVFDLDNTLLVGDIGEAVFAHLLLEKAPVKLTWSEYRRMIARDPASAYVALVDAMRGLEVSAVLRSTLKVITTSLRELTVEGALVPVPRPHPVMRSVVVLLQNLGYAVHVITASNQISARIVCAELLGIPEEHVHGMRSVIEGETMSDRILEPLPVGAGKREVYRTFVGTDAPFIVGGDSPLDIPLLDLVRPQGLVLWVVEDRSAF